MSLGARRTTQTKRKGGKRGGGGDVYRVTAYEGPAAANAVKNPARRFEQVCYRPDASIGKGYIDRLLEKSKAHRGSTFLMAVHGEGSAAGPAAMAHCTLRGSIPGFRGTRIVFVDLICSSKAKAGTGGILLDELEAYARALGARALALQSVLHPRTRGAYARRGFVRGAGNRSGAAVELARRHFQELAARPANLDRLLDCVDDRECRALLATQLREAREDDPRARASPEFLDALQGEFYPLHNTLYDGGNSVVMFKPLGANSRAARWSGAVDWQPSYARFVDPRRVELATYAPDPAERRMRKLNRGPATRPGEQPAPQRRSWSWPWSWSWRRG